MIPAIVPSFLFRSHADMTPLNATPLTVNCPSSSAKVPSGPGRSDDSGNEFVTAIFAVAQAIPIFRGACSWQAMPERLRDRHAPVNHGFEPVRYGVVIIAEETGCGK
jgi:hypothetical protein